MEVAPRTYRQIIDEERRARTAPPEANGGVESRVTWSEEEDLALYFELEKRYSPNLTSTFMRNLLGYHCCSLTILAATERYTNILHTPVLQNKLFEHIRERALYCKPFLLEEYAGREGGVPEWITSIAEM